MDIKVTGFYSVQLFTCFSNRSHNFQAGIKRQLFFQILIVKFHCIHWLSFILVIPGNYWSWKEHVGATLRAQPSFHSEFSEVVALLLWLLSRKVSWGSAFSTMISVMIKLLIIFLFLTDLFTCCFIYRFGSTVSPNLEMH